MFDHSFGPVFDDRSRVLILGSFPSVKSREQSFYYAHPQNRFWKVLASVFSDDVPQTTDEKKAFLAKHGVALWDVVKRCDVVGSSDSSIRNVEPNDIRQILSASPIETVIVNGKTAERLYNAMILPQTGVKAVCLPSTSPANAAFSLEKLCEIWSAVLVKK